MSVDRDNGTAMALMCDEVKRRWEEGDEKVSPIEIARWYEDDSSKSVEELREEGMIANAKDSIEMARNDLEQNLKTRFEASIDESVVTEADSKEEAEKQVRDWIEENIQTLELKIEEVTDE